MIKMLFNCRATIILPVLNEENYLATCLDSLLDTAVSFLEDGTIEIVIIDNGSIDETKKVASSYINMCPNIHLITEPIVGVGYARKTGTRFALARSLIRNSSKYDDFWIISTDADVTFPKNWITN